MVHHCCEVTYEVSRVVSPLDLPKISIISINGIMRVINL